MRTIAYLSIVLISGCLSFQSTKIKQTESQKYLTGITESGINSYLGIKYAAANRWSLPEINQAWAEPVSFEKFGSKCPQIGQESESEDCLFLNVYAPSSAQHKSNLPVVLWIHGGGFKAGSGNYGPKFWALDNIIVVTFNYRLGLLGFFNHPDWDIDHPRNFGQADMVTALKWVNTNISLFGGNPDNVTIAGHSAGGMGVQLMMIDSRAQNKFAKAISHAGYGNWPFPDIRLRKNDSDYKYSLIDKDTPVSKLVSLTPFYHLPYIGGFEIPEQPSTLFKTGLKSEVPYIAGFNSFDGQSTLAGAGYAINSVINEIKTDDILSQFYAVDILVDTKRAAKRFFGDLRYGVSARATAEALSISGQQSFLFYYDGRTYNTAGATHGIQYTEMFDKGVFAQKSYYINFIKTGSPNDDSLPAWESYSKKNPLWMTFNPNPLLQKMQLDQHLKYLEKRYNQVLLPKVVSE
jgi:para-nitrobenzyl esterase